MVTPDAYQRYGHDLEARDSQIGGPCFDFAVAKERLKESVNSTPETEKMKPIPDPDTISLFDAISNPDPGELESWLKNHGFPTDDEPVCLAAIHPDQWTDNCKVMPTPAIQRYIESGDILTDHTIDMMELALEKAYQTEAPWCIVSMRSGSEEAGTLNLDYFYLIKE
jgi:hypothetical protein